MHNLKDIKVWYKAISLSTLVYQLTMKYPADEKFGLCSQMKRAAISIASNIAEGAGRNSNKEFHHFLGIAAGSSFELLTQLMISVELNLIKKEEAELLYIEITQIQKMIYGFQKKLLKTT